MTPEECRAWLKAKVDEYIDEDTEKPETEEDLTEAFIEFLDHM